MHIGDFRLSTHEIITFANAFDAQPFHLDAEIAKTTLLGGLAASGWHSCTAQQRLISSFLEFHDLSFAETSFSEIRWTAPVRPDTAYATRLMEIEEQSGATKFIFEMTDENGVPAMQTTLLRHELVEPSPKLSRPQPQPSGLAFEDTALEAPQFLGSFAFNQANIADFHTCYSLKPAQTASPWHVCGGWMINMLAARQREVERVRTSGAFIPQFGPASGLQKLNWSGSVNPGDTIDYFSTAISKRQTPRPGWGTITTRNQGFNQNGVEILNFRATVFVGTRSEAVQ